MIVQLPYQFKNNIPTEDCCTNFLTLDLENYPFCQDKYFTLRLVNVSTGNDGSILNTYEYNGDLYTDNSLSTNDLILLINGVFVCAPDYHCKIQEAKFDYELSAIVYEQWDSTTIVDDVQTIQPSRIYTIDTITVNAVNYGVLPYTIWDDAAGDGFAADNVNEYIQRIIDYLNTLSIPELQGAINLGVDGASDNYEGVGLLQLYFTSGTTVTIDFSSDRPSTGTMVSQGDVTAMLMLELTDTSIIDAGDVIENITFIISDGDVSRAVNAQSDSGGDLVGTFFPYTIFNGSSLDTSRGWIINNVIASEQECGLNNLSNAVIMSTDILTLIQNGTPAITGSSI